MIYRKFFIFVVLLGLFLFTGCVGRNIPTKEQRVFTLQSLIPDSTFTSKTIRTNDYSFYTIQQRNEHCKNLHVYFEGDGLAWITKHIVSDDPTPLTPTTFKLMLQDNSKCKVYLARACQYTNDSKCSKKDWTSHRFSKQIVSSTNEVINQLKQKYQNDKFTFIGYSGGAAIASLVANKRDDVNTLVTVAGNLDTELWTNIKQLKPLIGSLNPVNYVNNLQTIKQYHLSGSNDKVIPFEVTESYIKQFDNKDIIKNMRIDATHSCCYGNALREILLEIE